MFMYTQYNTGVMSQAFENAIVNEAERTKMFGACTLNTVGDFVLMYSNL